ncbi:DUF3987 domain-containing protein [Shimia thalassica]|uniref:DUF3987 domain-containing protein n=1 Tax=Shimia thalassica TaxID=1715693 RepID=UPI0027336290|nr:DUF3987 domain-containing protein [Shimia thalassica]MDP2518730.1 DUF3987 domain-containing protein [Shimia thalassica]
MSNLQAALTAGFHPERIIPLIPVGGVLFQGGPVTDFDGQEYWEKPTYLDPKNFGKAPGELLQGEWALRTNWTNRPLTQAELQPCDAAGASAGLLCGDLYGGLDLDALDPALAAAWHQHVCQRLPTALHRIGQAPKRMIPFRVSGDPVRKTSRRLRRGDDVAVLEIIGQGAQFVLSGLHPATHAPYHWQYGTGLPVGPQVDALPVLTADQAGVIFDELINIAEGMGWEADRKKSAKGGEAKTSDLAKADPAVIDAAVREIPNNSDFDLWVKIGMAIKTELGDDGWPIWKEWSDRWDGGRDNESLLRRTYDKFNPDGSLSFGTIRQLATDMGVTFTSETQALIDADLGKRHFDQLAAGMPAVGELPPGVVPLPADGVVPLPPVDGGESPPEARWGAPVDVMQPVVAPPLPEACVPPVLRPLLALEAPAMGVPPEILFGACIGACVAALDDRLRIEPKAGRSWTEDPRLWIAMVGSASIKKTPAMKLGLKGARKLDFDFGREDTATVDAYFTALKRWTAQHKKFTEAKTDEDPGPAPTHPETRRIFIDDATVAKISDIAQHNPRGLTMVRDELSGWMASVEGRGEAAKDRAAYLELYNGEKRKFDRIGRGSLTVANWSASIVGGIQPSALQAAMKNAPNDGLLQRFYPIIANKAAKATNAVVDKAHTTNFQIAVGRLAHMGHGVVKLTAEADAILSAAWDKVFALIDGGNLSETVVSHLSKWEGGLYRWALILHALECGMNGQQAAQVLLPAHTARIVADLHLNYFLPNVFVLYDQVLGESGDMEHVRWVAGYILAHESTELRLRDLGRSYKRRWPAMEDSQKLRILRFLEDCGWIIPQEEKYLPKLWAINQDVYTVLQEQAAVERERRREIVESIGT